MIGAGLVVGKTYSVIQLVQIQISVRVGAYNKDLLPRVLILVRRVPVDVQSNLPDCLIKAITRKAVVEVSDPIY